MTEFKKRDTIKSYHFKPMRGRPDRYVIGRITDVIDGMIIFMVLGDVVEYSEEITYETPDELRAAGSLRKFLDTTGKPTFLKFDRSLPDEMRTLKPGLEREKYEGRVTKV
jgi:hypothetical protein